ncbi:MAG: NAD(P)-dependent oxidoreductase [Owenweeksia sp.]
MKVLIVDTVDPILHTGLKELGYEVMEDYQSPVDELKDQIPEFTGMIIRSRFPLNADFLKKAKTLRFIGRVGAGMENIDKATAESMGIKLLNAPEGNRNAVAEHALGMLLMLLNNLRIADAEVRKGLWKREANRGYELDGKTIGIIGYGYMGSAFAAKLKGFDVRILAYDKYLHNFGDAEVEESSLERITAEADVISFHLPQNGETIGYLNDDFVDKLQKPVYIINTARGKIVHTSALIRGLQSGKIKGACLDVLEYEKSSFENMFSGNIPEDFRYLLESDKVILSPHIAGWSYESNKKMAQTIVNKIAALNLL